MNPGSTLLPIETVLERIHQAFLDTRRAKQLSLENALGSYLYADVFASMNVPSYDNSAMDGYGFNSAYLSKATEYQVVAECFAGHVTEVDLGPDQCVRILTGAPIPAGVDTVIMQEDVQRVDAKLKLKIMPETGALIRRAGEDIARGDLVFAKGRQLNAADIAVLASLGICSIDVVSLPTVAVFSTGDELVPVGEEREPGQIYDSNRLAILMTLKEAGFTTLDLGIVRDNKTAIQNLVAYADEQADIVISSGGVSVGDADFTGQVLSEYGQLDFWKVAIKPGKPLAFGQLNRAKFFGLPGNPVSALVTLQQVVVPQIIKTLCQSDSRKIITAIAAARFHKTKGRTDYQRGIFSLSEQGFKVKPTGSQSSGILSSVARANCFVILERDRGDVEEGERVNIVLR